MKRLLSSAFSVALLVTACSGGFTKLGEGDGGSGGGGSGKAGSASGGSPGAGPCDGLPCGAVCTLCDPADAACQAGVARYCDAEGGCGLAFPVCEAAECDTNKDCPQPGAPCEQCEDGSFACPTVECFAGKCVGSFPTCGGNACKADQDCPQIGAPCQVCADGTTACPWTRCESGSCLSGIDTCADTSPCAGKACGETCSTCPPGAACPAVVMFCDQNEKCQYNQPVCSTNGCETDADCPAVDACPACPDANSCAELRCLEGACKFQCPTAGSCGTQGDSCANGEKCCGGLECCAGVPTPAGKEYCGQVCPISDRNIKSDFASVNQTDILEKVASLPISTWVYKTETSSARHIGPMAQDFMATFGVGSSDRTILQVDADGVTFAAIQALYDRLQRVEQRNAELERDLRLLKSR